MFIKDLYFTSTDTEVEQINDQATTLPPLKTYVQECIAKTAKYPVWNIGFEGGAFAGAMPGRTEIEYHSGTYKSLCNYVNGVGCVNQLLTREIMEEQLEEYIEPELLSCINLSLFERLGYGVLAGDLETDVLITIDEVIVKARYPIRIEKIDDIQEEENYIATIDAPLGKLYDLSMNILNSEIKDGFFDKDLWMLNHSVMIRIDKHRPYPNIVYNLSTDDLDGLTYSFLFSLIGRDTVNLVGEEIIFEENTGKVCYNEDDDTCFFNAPEGGCPAPLIDSDTGCEGEGLTVFGNEPGSMDGCTFNGFEYGHGNSWCAIHGAASTGFEYVGSRFYLHTCIDGKVYIEDCRDFREEVCAWDKDVRTEYLGSNGQEYTAHGKGMCRPNRWQDCTYQGESSCGNKNERDCVWDTFYVMGNKPIRGMCVPEVSPGFKFWVMNGIQVCELANDYRTCDGMDMSCPQTWTNGLERRCSKLGDCGNNYNYKGEFTQGGFFSSDDYGNPQDRVFLSPFAFVGNLFKGRTDARSRRNIPSDVYYDPAHSYEGVIGYAMDYIQEASGWGMCDWFKCKSFLGVRYPTRYVGHVISAAVCMPWQAPTTWSCDACGEDEENYPCTEYKCKSLGKGCSFYWDDDEGKGVCGDMPLSDTGEFRTQFLRFSDNISSAVAPYDTIFNFETTMIGDGHVGVENTDLVSPGQTFFMEFNTSEATMCYTTPFPPYLLEDIQMFPMLPFLSGFDTNFTKAHRLQITAPDLNDIINSTLNQFNVSSLLEGLSIMNDPMAFLNSRPELAQALAYSGYSVADIQNQIDDFRAQNPIAVNLTESFVMDYFVSNAFEEGHLYQFLVCQMPDGTINDVPIRVWHPGATYPVFDYIKIRVNISHEDDQTPPRILYTEPATFDNITGSNVNIKVYTDRPAECRITTKGSVNQFFYNGNSYNQLDASLEPMRCTSGLASAIDGNRCNLRINITAAPGETVKYFIKCRSNPRKVDEYSFVIKPTPGLTLPSVTDSQNSAGGTQYVWFNHTEVMHLWGSNNINYERNAWGNRTEISAAPGVKLGINISRREISDCYAGSARNKLWETNMALIPNPYSGSIFEAKTYDQEYFIQCVNSDENIDGYSSNKYRLELNRIR